MGRKSITVRSCAYIHVRDIEPEGERAGGDKWEGLVNRCVKAAQDALETPPPGYSPIQRNSLTDLFSSLKATHRGIRLFIQLGDEKPESVDALVLARLQLEALYNLCLLLEAPNNVDRFVRDAWRRQYVNFLLYREETKALPRFHEPSEKEHQRLLVLAGIWRVSEQQRLTVEYEELGAMPPGFSPEPIEDFPTPGRIIREMPGGAKRQMLKRLYPEYQELCAYAHGRPVAGFGKAIFDGRSMVRRDFGEELVQRMFDTGVKGATQIYSVLAVA